MKKIISPTILLSFVLLLTSLVATESSAMPMFAKRIGRDCSYCHVAFPKLNETGRIFKSNGYRFAEEEEWEEVKDMGALPLALEVEMEGEFDYTKAGVVETRESDMTIDEIAILAGAVLGKEGRVTAHGIIGIEHNSEPFSHGYIQINDLYGTRGEGRLNLKAGMYEVALPFLSGSEGIIKNGYFANSALDVFSMQMTVELNGSIVGEEETSEATHRYAVGITREDINSDNKFKGFFASYSRTYWEIYNVGVIYRRGEEKYGVLDAFDRSASRYGIAGEAEVGPAFFTLGLFRAERDGLEDLDNILLEGLYFPIEDLILGGRVDILKQNGAEDSLALSLIARYNIMLNVFAHAELRTLKDDNLIGGGMNEEETKGRLFLEALF